jgi:hypothetical protein
MRSTAAYWRRVDPVDPPWCAPDYSMRRRFPQPADALRIQAIPIGTVEANYLERVSKINLIVDAR